MVKFSSIFSWKRIQIQLQVSFHLVLQGVQQWHPYATIMIAHIQSLKSHAWSLSSTHNLRRQYAAEQFLSQLVTLINSSLDVLDVQATSVQLLAFIFHHKKTRVIKYFKNKIVIRL